MRRASNRTQVPSTKLQHLVLIAVQALLALLFLANVPAIALEADPDEKDRLEACEESFCTAVLNKGPKSKNVACQISKTWNRSKIKKGASTKSISWGFGDAKCHLAVNLLRSQIQTALKAKKHKLFIPAHTVKCQVETEDGIKPVRVTLSPTLKFKFGRVKKVRLKVKKIEGPTLIRSLIWSTVNLEKSLGIFHGEMVEEINEFLHDKCPERHG
ncbi:MAG: hypothetical protein AAFO75_10880 [Pseudomonadota bacterium]